MLCIPVIEAELPVHIPISDRFLQFIYETKRK